MKDAMKTLAKGIAMRTTIKTLLIVALVSLLVVAIVGCEEKGAPNKSAADLPNQASKVQDAKEKPDDQNAADKIKTASSIQPQLISITLYFSDEQAEYLIPETRHIEKSENIAKAALEELIKGPKESSLHATVPSETRVLGVDIEKDTAYANFSKELVDKHWGGSTGELMTITSIVNTLTEFENIKKVQILVEGKVVETIAGHLDVSRPLTRDETVIKK